MNREQLLKEREIYIKEKPLRIINEWYDNYIKKGNDMINVSVYDDSVITEVRNILKDRGFNTKIKGGGVSFDGYPNDTYIYIENV